MSMCLYSCVHVNYTLQMDDVHCHTLCVYVCIYICSCMYSYIKSHGNFEPSSGKKLLSSETIHLFLSASAKRQVSKPCHTITLSRRFGRAPWGWSGSVHTSDNINTDVQTNLLLLALQLFLPFPCWKSSSSVFFWHIGDNLRYFF